MSARLGHAAQVSFKSYERGLQEFQTIEQQAQARGYAQLLAKIRVTRANSLRALGRYVDSIEGFDQEVAFYAAQDDAEGMATSLSRRAGVYRTGAYQAWRDALQALRLSGHVGARREQHNLFGEAASTALSLGHPRAALLYQNAAIRITNSTRERAMALRNRAAINLALDHPHLATADLDAATRIDASVEDETARRILEARTEEIGAQTQLQLKATAGAIAAFTRALTAASPEKKTFIASLLAQRAQAYRLAGERSLAEQDLSAALAALDEEEAQMLERRKRGQGEDLRTAYFSRFQTVYQSLIAESIEQGRVIEALQYAERARP